MPQVETKKLTLILGSLGIIASLATTINFSTKSANAASSCECTQYVRNRFGLSPDFPNAKDWNDGYLQRNGFTQTSVKVGAIVVMEASFSGANSTYGHVGVVESIDAYGRITVRGANQYIGTTLVTESDCTNVRSTPFKTSINGRGDISFWQKGTTPPPPPPPSVTGLKTYFVDNFALNTNNNFVRLDGFPIMSSWTKNYNDPDQQLERLQGNFGTLLKHKSTGGCLNAHYLSNGSQMNVWSPCNAGDIDQNWAFSDLGNGYFHIKRANSNSCVDMPGRSNGGKIHLWQCDPNNSNQRWRTN